MMRRNKFDDYPLRVKVVCYGVLVLAIVVVLLPFVIEAIKEGAMP